MFIGVRGMSIHSIHISDALTVIYAIVWIFDVKSAVQLSYVERIHRYSALGDSVNVLGTVTAHRCIFTSKTKCINCSIPNILKSLISCCRCRRHCHRQLPSGALVTLFKWWQRVDCRRFPSFRTKWKLPFYPFRSIPLLIISFCL